VRERLYIVVFVIALGLAAAVVLTGANYFLNPLYEANKERESKGNVLIALGIEGWDKARVKTATMDEIKQAFGNHIVTVYKGRELAPGEELPPGEDADFYLGYGEAGRKDFIGYAFKMTGAGFWDRISGYLAVDPAVEKVIGITFYEDNETPGLGHKINDADWQQTWIGRSIYKPGTDEPWIGIVPPGTETKADQVHAISGATETSTAVQKFLNARLRRFLAGVKTYTAKHGAPGGGPAGE
jgi:Na+-transporting NADH:ubiquinone oxidoreductase subunit NqrC